MQFVSSYWIHLLTTIAVSALLARSIGLVTGRLGIISLCQLSFAAIGGWVVSWVSANNPSISFILLVFIAAASTFLVGFIIGAATQHIRGVELAVVTLGFATAIDLLFKRQGFPGASTGSSFIPNAPFNDPQIFFLLSWIFLLTASLLLTLFNKTNLGLGIAAIKSSERAAAALGINVGMSKSFGFAVGATISGSAGAFMAGQYGLLSNELFTPLASMIVLATAVLTGASILSGALLAGAFAVLVPEALRRLGLPLDLTGALFAIGAFDVLRRGQGGIAEQLQAKLQNHKFKDAVKTCELKLGSPAKQKSAENNNVSDALFIRNLSVAFSKNQILKEVNLTVSTTGVHALIGPNGAGKTTLIDAVTGFVGSPDGNMFLGAQKLSKMSVRQRSNFGLKRTFQHTKAIDALTIEEYLKLTGEAKNPHKAKIVQEFFNLPNQKLPIRLLDGASKRILEIAGTLINEPKIILLDEPAAGLNEEDSLILAKKIQQIPQMFGCGILIVEHNINFVKFAATEVTVLDGGQVIAHGDTSETLENENVIQAYLGSGIE
ncbi:MAG TPA: ATP-binding cassette domain-containing protein [Microbacteriaceae bacterium]|nr:ATP-binding cassette domain-containing protein [Microbacteriaceae bacterium]